MEHRRAETHNEEQKMKNYKSEKFNEDLNKWWAGETRRGWGGWTQCADFVRFQSNNILFSCCEDWRETFRSRHIFYQNISIFLADCVSTVLGVMIIMIIIMIIRLTKFGVVGEIILSLKRDNQCSSVYFYLVSRPLLYDKTEPYKAGIIIAKFEIVLLNSAIYQLT